ncbi:MAG TPA: hypothetical protein VL485_23555 [Ktedonobacteraceae bacterium]|jgi:hypothetical protein|nr:hypothetical protein [Ktedonobacteraceae bacterium]
MKKVCPGCGEEKDAEEDFRWKVKDQKRQTWCRFCQAQANRVHYQNNKQVYLDRAKLRNSRVIEENQRKLYAYLSEHPCVDCGHTDVRVLEFDHVRGEKVESIARLVRLATSWPTIDAEIAKCEVRCANCHRIKTNERGGWWRHFIE